MPSEGADLRLRSVLDIGRAFASTLDRDALLALILEHVTALVEADRSTLFLLDEDRRELWAKIAQGAEAREIRVKLGEGIAGWVAATGRTVRVDDAYDDPRFHDATDRATGYRTRSVLSVPLRDSGGRTVGVLQCLNKRGGAFSPDDERLLEALGGHAATALENARLYASLRERVRELDMLVAIEREVSAAHDLDEALDGLLRRAMELVGAAAGSVVLLDASSADLHFRSARGVVADEVRRQRLRRGEGIAGWVAERGEPALVHDPASDPRHFTDLAERVGFRPRNVVCVPFFADEGPAGAVELLDKLPEGERFDDADVKLLTLIAGQVGKTVGLARAREERLNETRLAAVGKTLAGVLHDLRTPMTVISGYAQIMADDPDGATRARHSEEIARQCDRMSAMIREVLAFARGEGKVLARKVHVGPFLDDVARDLREGLRGRGVEIALDARYRGDAVFDEEKVRRAIHNLARNAAEAMPAGGRFTIGARMDDGDLLLTFSDTGAGIPPEMEGRLFEPFATAGKRDGTGLGLAIVRKIVEDHGGRIRYRTQVGEGTTFDVRLPQGAREG